MLTIEAIGTKTTRLIRWLDVDWSNHQVRYCSGRPRATLRRTTDERWFGSASNDTVNKNSSL